MVYIQAVELCFSLCSSLLQLHFFCPRSIGGGMQGLLTVEKGIWVKTLSLSKAEERGLLAYVQMGKLILRLETVTSDVSVG